uniref:CARD domain-containing protein n=1 Tax=Amphimedon queenslandica TaxID=400682 RepID=A0A1X7SKV7_AMPQE
MNQKPAATLIRNTYDDPASQILQHYSDRVSQVSLTDSCIQLLYTEGLITEDTQRKIERCGGSLSDTLRELMIAVSDDHSKLRSLGNILMELEETKPLAQDIIKDCDKWFSNSDDASTTTGSPHPSVTVPVPSDIVDTPNHNATKSMTYFCYKCISFVILVLSFIFYYFSFFNFLLLSMCISSIILLFLFKLFMNKSEPDLSVAPIQSVRPVTSSTSTDNHLPAASANTTVSADKFFFNSAYKPFFNEIRGSFGSLRVKLVPLLTQSIPSAAELKSFLQLSF